MKEKITVKESKDIHSLLASGRYSLQEISNYFDNRYTLNQLMYHIEKNYSDIKNLLKKEYSRGGSKLLFLLKQIFPARKVHAEYHVGNKLRLDAYVSSPYNLGFEFDGVQHNQKVSHFHESNFDFQNSQDKDNEKTERCNGRGINIIRFQNIEELTIEKLKSTIEEIGYGSGQILNDSFLTKKEIRERQKKERDAIAKEQAKAYSLSHKKILPIKRKETFNQSLEYKEKLKERLKEQRKQQYEASKEWKKQFKENFKKKLEQS